MSDLLISCHGLTKLYGHKIALQNVSLDIGRGRFVGLLGPNGSGKTTLIKILCGLLQPTAGDLSIDGQPVGVHSKSIISYLPDRMYFADWVDPKDRLKTMSKGTKEKVQLVMVMARKAQLYLLDEPIAGVDPAARDFILNTILTNYNEEGTVLISTHLISDIERVLDEVIFLKAGQVMLHNSVDNIREQQGKSVDALFREVFRTVPLEGGER